MNIFKKVYDFFNQPKAPKENRHVKASRRQTGKRAFDVEKKASKYIGYSKYRDMDHNKGRFGKRDGLSRRFFRKAAHLRRSPVPSWRIPREYTSRRDVKNHTLDQVAFLTRNRGSIQYRGCGVKKARRILNAMRKKRAA